MPDDPNALLAALDSAEDAFGSHTTGRLEYEEGLDPDAHDANVIQLRKACRLLDACRLLREHGGYYTSVIEMSFAASERTLECYALNASNDTIDDFREGHDRAYDRAADLALVTDETTRRMKQLYRDNRAAAYYRDTVAAAQQADAIFTLAVVVHDHVTEFARLSHECHCRR